jgi:GTPase SAR1 family protein
MGIEVLKFLYKNEAFVDVEIWDSAGQERFNENYLYSQSYV